MTARETKLERALLAIEGLALAADCEDEMGMVYTIAHNATGHCDSGECHSDELLERVITQLKAGSIIDVDEVMARKVTT